VTEVSNSQFHNTTGARNFEAPEGGEVRISDSVFTKAADAPHRDVIGYGSEPCRHSGTMILERIRVINNRAIGAITNYGRCPGQPIRVESIAFEGEPVQFIGDVRTR
jgi:hypothetical protein